MTHQNYGIIADDHIRTPRGALIGFACHDRPTIAQNVFSAHIWLVRCLADPPQEPAHHAVASEYLSAYQASHAPALLLSFCVFHVALRDVRPILSQLAGDAMRPLSGPELGGHIVSAYTFRPPQPLPLGKPFIAPYEVRPGFGVLATSAVWPPALAIYQMVEPPTATRFPFFRGLSSYAPFFLTASWEPEDAAKTQREIIRSKRLQSGRDSTVDASEQATELGNALASGLLTVGRVGLVAGFPAHDENSRLEAARTLGAIQGLGSLVMRSAGINAHATFLAAHHEPALQSNKERLTSENFADLATPSMTAAVPRPLTFGRALNAEIQPVSWYVEDVGHTMVCGPTGTGKTVLLGHLVAASLNRGFLVTLIDQHRGFRTFADKFQGTIWTIDATTELDDVFGRALSPYLARWWVLFLTETTGARNDALFIEAIRTVYALPEQERSLQPVLMYLESYGHPLGTLPDWYTGAREQVFHTSRVLDLAHLSYLDLTLADPIIIAYITTLWMERLTPSRRAVLIIDEAWAAFASPDMAAWLSMALRVCRKLGGDIVCASQHISDFSDTLLTNMPTKILAVHPAIREHLPRIAELSPEEETLWHRCKPRSDYLVVRPTQRYFLRLELPRALLHYHRPD